MKGKQIHRGSYTVTRRYEFYVWVARIYKIHIFVLTCIFFIWTINIHGRDWKVDFSSSTRYKWKQKRRRKMRESCRRCSIWPLVLHTKNTPLGSRMKGPYWFYVCSTCRQNVPVHIINETITHKWFTSRNFDMSNSLLAAFSFTWVISSTIVSSTGPDLSFEDRLGGINSL